MENLNYIINSSPLHCQQFGPEELFAPNTGEFWDNLWTGDFYQNDGFRIYSQNSGVILLPNSDEVAKSNFSSFAFAASGQVLFASEYEGSSVIVNNESYNNYDIVEFLGISPVLFSERNIIHDGSGVKCFYSKPQDNNYIFYRNLSENFSIEHTGFNIKNTRLIGINLNTKTAFRYQLLYLCNKQKKSIELLKNYDIFENLIQEDFSGLSNIPEDTNYGFYYLINRRDRNKWCKQDFSGITSLEELNSPPVVQQNS